jgi:PAS domain S-box-containing protein
MNVEDAMGDLRAPTAGLDTLLRRHSKDLFRAIVQTANEGIWLVGTDTKTVYANDRMATMLGYTPDELAERALLACVYPADAPLAAQHIQRNLAGESEQFDLRFRCKDGAPLDVLACTSPMRDAGGTVVGALGMFTDVTRRKSLEADLVCLYTAEREARAAAEEAVRAREEFLSIVSHELRTPLTAMDLQVQMLRRQARRADILPAEQVREAAERIARQEKRFLKLIDDLLDVTRLDRGRMELSPEPVDLSALVHETVDRLQVEAREAEAVIEVQAQTPVQSVLDRLRIEQVMTNLISNAIKYGGSPITVSVEASGDVARIRVADRGEGIAPEDQPRIFDRYVRIENASGAGGVGLGLYIARQMVNAHGGTIGVESTPGQGSTFTVELPLAEETPASLA